MYMGQENVSVEENLDEESFLDPDKAIEMIEEYRKEKLKKLGSVYLLAPLMIWTGYRGKIGTITRGALIAMGVSALYTNYKEWQKMKEVDESYLKAYFKNLKSSLINEENKNV